MALIKCNHCGKSVSDKASICPKCRKPLKEETLPVNDVSFAMDGTAGVEISEDNIVISENSEKYYKKISIISYTIISVIILGIFIGFWLKWKNM